MFIYKPPPLQNECLLQIAFLQMEKSFKVQINVVGKLENFFLNPIPLYYITLIVLNVNFKNS